MNLANVLINNRENLVDELFMNYSYEYLVKIFSEINSLNNESIMTPNNKYLYRLLTGTYFNSKYSNSSIDCIPSKELLNGIINIADHFNINTLEEINAGMGLLSALLIKENINLNNKLTVTTSDICNCIATCNKLNFVPIALRNSSDFKFYPKLNEEYPKMIISSFYPDKQTGKSSVYQNFIEEIYEMLQNNNHEIIILILPHTFTNIHDVSYHWIKSTNYSMHMYYTKALDKYFFLSNLMKTHYGSGIITYIFTRKDVLSRSPKSMDEIFQPAIIPSLSIDTHCFFSIQLQKFYEKLPSKLIEHIYFNNNFTKSALFDTKFKKICESHKLLKIKKIKEIPSYIYETDEFLFWTRCICHQLFFLFDTREQFFNFYIQSLRITNSKNKTIIDFPSWARSPDCRYKFVYLDVIKKTYKSSKNFNDVFNGINEKNKKLLTEH